MGFWKVQSLDLVHQLREVTIELSSGSNGTEFARYILEHAQNLNKMTIVHSPHQSNAIRALKKSRMAANAKVVCQEDQNRGTEGLPDNQSLKGANRIQDHRIRSRSLTGIVESPPEFLSPPLDAELILSKT